jgi:hypothetical protein
MSLTSMKYGFLASFHRDQLFSVKSKDNPFGF